MSRITNRKNSMPNLKRTLDDDEDAETDQQLLRDQKTWSKGRIRRMKIISLITGNQQPSRRKIFSEIQTTADVKIWSIQIHGTTITCAKIFNPAILEKNNGRWEEISKVQRLEVEDPEGTLSSIPKHVLLEMTKLDSFSMTWTKVKSFPSSLFSQNLRSMYVQRNQLKNLNGIERAENLEILDVSNNQLSTLPKTIGQLQSLTTLNLSGNSLKELPEAIGQLAQLKSLDCSCNKLKTLPDSICNIIELNSLDICNNQICFLPDSIGCLPKLEDLRARSNLLQMLPAGFGQLVNLHSLLLRKNHFVEVPEQLSHLPNLQNLNMRDNMIKQMRNSIHSLKNLILDGNELQGIDPAILECSNLEMLWLQSNKIVEIPENIFQLKNLRALHLSGNAITTVPTSIDRLEHLRHFSLRATKIQTLPKSICTMSNLTFLDLDECTELECYLKMEYKKKGLVGVRMHLHPPLDPPFDPPPKTPETDSDSTVDDTDNKKPTEQDDNNTTIEIVPSDQDTLRPPPSRRENRRIVDMTSKSRTEKRVLPEAGATKENMALSGAKTKSLMPPTKYPKPATSIPVAGAGAAGTHAGGEVDYSSDMNAFEVVVNRFKRESMLPESLDNQQSMGLQQKFGREIFEKMKAIEMTKLSRREMQ